MIANIPQEMRNLPQWVCATSSEVKSEDKIPINPVTGTMASPTNRDTWVDFLTAAEGREKWPHVGFVLTSTDPYCIIDLDDPYDPSKDWDEAKRDELAALNSKILDSFPSYTEVSQSGKGAHIVVRGSVPHGVNRDTVEMYSSQRYMICTGRIIKDLPIMDCQVMLTALFEEMDSHSRSIPLVENEQTMEDEDIIAIAGRAENGAKFNRLYSGEWSEYGSQSEADFALLAIIAFYTDSNEQVRRIFRQCPLGQRDKSQKNDTYLNFALGKIRAANPPPEEVDFSELKRKVAEFSKPQPNPVDTYNQRVVEASPQLGASTEGFAPTPPPDVEEGDIYPPGLVGEVAAYITESAARPVKLFGLMGALGLISGLVGRQYNISGVGLNHYLILLAKTGSGKEGIVSGIDRLMGEVRKSVPMVDQFQGPSAFASGPALVKHMSDSPAFLSVLGEFGLTLQQLCDPKAMGAHVSLRHALLDLYQKSGKHSALKASVYSDKEKNTDLVQSPALSLLGESTPETFLEGLSEYHIADGLIPRFTIQEYTGQRPYLNARNGFKPSDSLISKLVDLSSLVLTMQSNNSHVDVVMEDGAKALSDAFEKETTDLINGATNQVYSQLWNRAHLKVLKLAALIAVGCNYNHPVITERTLTWAMDFVKKDIGTLLNRFENGDVGSGESKQTTDLFRKIDNYFRKPQARSNRYKKYRDNGAIPVCWFRDNIKTLASFRNDPRGGSRALREQIQEAVESAYLAEMPPTQCFQKFQTKAKVFILGDNWQAPDPE